MYVIYTPVRKSKMLFLLDPCGIFCLLITYAGVLYADYVIVRWIIMLSSASRICGLLHVVLFNTVVLLLSAAHAKATLTDPGRMPLPRQLDDRETARGDPGNGQPLAAGWTNCKRCGTGRPPRAHHCSICRRCIRRKHHHCPWINNCVGERNQQYFLQFLVYVGLLSTYSICLVLYSWIKPCTDCRSNVLERDVQRIHCAVLLLQSATFGAFVCLIIIDQLHSIFWRDKQPDSETHRPQRRRKFLLLAEVFDWRHPAFWLLPCASPSRLIAVHHQHDSPPQQGQQV